MRLCTVEGETVNLNNDASNKVGDMLCNHYDRLIAGAIELRLAMRVLAEAGHIGCRHRLERVWIAKPVEVSDQETKSV